MSEQIKTNKIQIAKEIMEALQFLHGDDYGKEFNRLRKTGMTLDNIHTLLGEKFWDENTRLSNRLNNRTK